MIRDVEVCLSELRTRGVLIRKGHLQSHQQWQCLPQGHSEEGAVEGTALGGAWPYLPRKASERPPLRHSRAGQVPTQPVAHCEMKSPWAEDMVNTGNSPLKGTLLLQQKAGDPPLNLDLRASALQCSGG